MQSWARCPEIGRWQKLRARCRSCRTSLADTGEGSGKIKILVQGALHYSHNPSTNSRELVPETPALPPAQASTALVVRLGVLPVSDAESLSRILLP